MLFSFNFIKSIILILCLLGALYGRAQTSSPGAVSSNLELWLRCDNLNLTSGTSANWSSFRTSPVTTSPNSSYPVKRNINFNKSILLNNNYFNSALDINVDEVNILAVYKLDVAPSSGASIPLWGNGGGSTSFLGKQATTSTITKGGINFQSYSGADIANRVYINHIHSKDNDSSFVYINGLEQASYTTDSTVGTNLHSGIFIGELDGGGPSATNLNIAEFIVYRDALSQQEIEQINSYLAIKYGITLEHNYSIDDGNSIVWDQALNTGYNYNITAIAIDTKSSLTQSKSKSENPDGVLTISVAGGISTNKDALVVGSNNGATNNSTTFQSSTNLLLTGKRINRVWKNQQTPNFPATTIEIDTSIGLPSGFNAKNIFLLVADDADFSANLKAYPLSINTSASNHTYEALNVDLTTGQYFTIARSDLSLWIKAGGAENRIVGGKVDSLYDYALGLNSLEGKSIGSNDEPVHILGTANSSMNYNSYVGLNQGANRNYLEKSKWVGFGESGTSAFMVLRTDTITLDHDAMLSYAIDNGSFTNEWVITKPSAVKITVGETTVSNGRTHYHDITDNKPHIVAHVRGNGNDNFLRLDGGNSAGINYKNTSVIRSGGTMIFGQEQDQLGGGFSAAEEYYGDLAEAIVFSKRLGNQQRNIIESYLALKYGITLEHNYKFSDASVVWNKSNNSTYHNNVAGIGRDDVLGLDHKKSTSQNGTSVDVTVEHVGAFNQDLSYLIWGCNTGAYSPIDSLGAPNDYKVSQKIWKVQNKNNQIQKVKATFKLPTLATAQDSSSLRLLVHNNPDFSTGAAAVYIPPSVPTTGATHVSFDDVFLKDGYYFRLALVEDPSYVNHDLGAPTTFEACPGSDVTFYYNNLTQQPDAIEFLDTAGLPLILSGASIAVSNTASSPYSGSINLTIPLHTGTGNVRLLAGSNVLYNFNASLIVHNPSLDFVSLKTTICATDTIKMLGVPPGGSFSAVGHPNLFSQDTLIGANAKWLEKNTNTITIPVTYEYTPSYIGGMPCRNAIEKTKGITIRDNRLDALLFKPIVATSSPPSAADRKVLTVDSTTIYSLVPSLGGHNFPISLSGNAVWGNTFLTDFVGTGRHALTLQYNNGGCIGEQTGWVDVLSPPQHIGLVDSLCRGADSIVFVRDTLDYAYAYKLDTFNYYDTTGAVIEVVRAYEQYKWISTQTKVPAHQGAINNINTLQEQRSFSFNPQDPSVSSASFVVVETQYKTSVLDLPSLVPLVEDTISVLDTIHLLNSPNLSIGLAANYCENSDVDTLKLQPSFASNMTNYLELYIQDSTGNYTIPDTLLQDTILDIPTYVTVHGMANNAIGMQLKYVNHYYGCVDSITRTTTIEPKPTVSIDTNSLQSDYCINSSVDTLIGLPSGNGYYQGQGLDSASGQFDPFAAGLGQHILNYIFTDGQGCTATAQDTVTVHNLPNAMIASPVNNHVFLNTDARVPLTSTTSYFKNIFTSATSPIELDTASSTYYFNPATSTLGAHVVTYTATSTYGCENSVQHIYVVNDASGSVTYKNLDTLAPVTFEACAGSKVAFEYANLDEHPNQVQLMGQNGQPISIGNLVVTSVPGPPPGKHGTVEFTIPHDAATGIVQLLNTTLLPSSPILYTSNTNLLVHNPILNIVVPKNPICATDTILVTGVPLGGVFSAVDTITYPNLFNQSQLIGLKANWSLVNDSAKSVDIQYSYTASYLNGTSCLQPIVLVDSVQLRDNRLYNLEFNFIVTDSILPTRQDRKELKLGSNIIKTFSPNLDTAYHFPVSFIGSYVGQYASTDSFLTDYAGFGEHWVTLEYQNGACIGSYTSEINVLSPIRPFGLPDVLCIDANPVSFTRDTTTKYRYGIDTTFAIVLPNGNTLIRYEESNKIQSVTTRDTSLRNAIVAQNIIPNQEQYLFVPDSLPSQTSRVIIEMYYVSDTTVVEMNSSGAIVSSQNTSSDPFVGSHIIDIKQRPNLTFSLDSFYCKNAPRVDLQPTPIIDQPATTYFYYNGNTTGLSGNYQYLDTLGGSSFSPKQLYNQHNSAGTNDLNLELLYVVDRYGCRDSLLKTTKIVKPIAVDFTINSLNTEHCESADSINLEPLASLATLGGTGEFLVGDTSNSISIITIGTSQYFSPQRAKAGTHQVTYQFTDSLGCISTSTKPIKIRKAPQIELAIDGKSVPPIKLCANSDSIVLETTLLSGGAALGINYDDIANRLVINGNILNPQASIQRQPNATSIVDFIKVDYVDSVGCAANDILPIEIYKPDVDISGFVQNQFCSNEAAFVIAGVSNTVSSMDTLVGTGVIDSNNVYWFDPSLAMANAKDTVTYTLTDTLGCMATIEKVIQIDSIPIVDLTALNGSYCINDTIQQLQGIPNAGVVLGTGIYGGNGVNPNTGSFTPAIAGVNVHLLTYEFTDNNGCTNRDVDTVEVHGLPIPRFSGYKINYCTTDLLDTLDSDNHPAPNSSYRFWGNIIDSMGVLNPALATLQGGAGVQQIFYAYTDTFGCENTKDTTIVIHQAPEIIISGLDSAYCANGAPDNISVSPPSGTFLSSHAAFTTNGSNTIFFDPANDTTTGQRNLTYVYVDPNTGCSDTLQVRTYVYHQTAPTIVGLDSFYCEIDSLYAITGLPAGGLFQGVGMLHQNNQDWFNPSITGGGTYTIDYTVGNIFLHDMDTIQGQDSLVCHAQTDQVVTVHSLPAININAPGDNYQFCSNDTMVSLKRDVPSTWNLVVSNEGGIDTTMRQVDIPLGGGLFRRYIFTTYYFDPGLASLGPNNITYTVTDSLTGCQNTMEFTYFVNQYQEASFLTLDSVYCASSDSVELRAVPLGGIFINNGDTLDRIAPYFHPTLDPLNTGTAAIDTIIYAVDYSSACFSTDTQLVKINPVVDVSFVGTNAHKVYCLGEGTEVIPLVPNITGGTFLGQGILSGQSNFMVHIAGVGHHPLTYTYMDSLTGCASVYEDTFSVYGMPNVSFSVVGGCQLDSVFFKPDNAILGLDNIFNNRVIDSITSVTWELDTAITLSGTSDSNNIDSFSYTYNSPGVYDVKLSVANQEHCIDTQTVRLVISPKISSFPYDENFESSHGNWYAETRTSSHNLLWQWGQDNNGAGIAAGGNKFWSTNLNGSYQTSEDAWVYSPCFDLSNLERPMIKLNHWSDGRQGSDGAVIEYQKQDGTWAPLGVVDRGINWFNTDVINGRPGDQGLAPIGWSGQTFGWVDSRYMLDEFRTNNDSLLRLRVAFGSSDLGSGLDSTFYDGFGFDNVWIGSRSRNVLLETVANKGLLGMDVINNHTYNLAFHSYINQDVVLMQYHYKIPLATDEFYLFNEGLAENRATLYKFLDVGPGYTFIDGDRNNKKYSRNLGVADLEEHMLDFPKFDVRIDTFHHNSFGVFTTEVTVEALENMPLDEYAIRIVITEDSLTYSGGFGSLLHAVAREDNREEDDSLFYVKGAWSIGQTKTIHFDWNHSSTNINYKPKRFQVVAYVQSVTGDNPVFQATTSRDVSGYWIGVDQVKAEPELQEIVNMNVYPNPAKDYFRVDFEQELEQDYQWKLLDLRGVEYQSGVLEAGVQQLEVENYDLPTGVYIFSVYNKNVFAQRKLVINQY